MLEKPGKLLWSEDHRHGTMNKNTPIRAGVTPVWEDTASPELNPKGASDGPAWQDSLQREGPEPVRCQYMSVSQSRPQNGFRSQETEECVAVTLAPLPWHRHHRDGW